MITKSNWMLVLYVVRPEQFNFIRQEQVSFIRAERFKFLRSE